MNKKYASVMIAIAAIMTTAFIFFVTNAFDDLPDDPNGDFYVYTPIADTEDSHFQETSVPGESCYTSTTAQEPSVLYSIVESMHFQLDLSWYDYMYLLEQGAPINQTLTYENFELEVLGAIAVAGVPFYDLNWEYMSNRYEETGEWPHDHDEKISVF